MTEYIELSEPLEKPKKVLSEKQKENLAKGRAVKQGKIALDVEAKANKKLEDRFNALVAMFEKIQLPSPEVQQKIKAKRAPVEQEVVSDDEEEPKPKKIEKPRPVVQVQPNKQIFFSFK
jgi:NADH:ubiquinone oxidoreductase subunit D